jgi:hypothetical protein
MKRISQALAVMTAAAFFQGTAQAVPLAPGGTVALPAGVETGTLLYNEPGQAFSTGHPGSASYVAGTFYEAVYKESNGTLDFAYQVTITSNGSNGKVASFSVADFTAITTDVSQSSTLNPPPGTGNTGLSTASRSIDGSTLTFSSVTPLTAGSTTYVALVKTDAVKADMGGSAAIALTGGGVYGLNTVMVFEPATVPEPLTLILWGGSFAGLCVGALRSRKVFNANA